MKEFIRQHWKKLLALTIIFALFVFSPFAENLVYITTFPFVNLISTLKEPWINFVFYGVTLFWSFLGALSSVWIIGKVPILKLSWKKLLMCFILWIGFYMLLSTCSIGIIGAPLPCGIVSEWEISLARLTGLGIFNLLVVLLLPILYILLSFSLSKIKFTKDKKN